VDGSSIVAPGFAGLVFPTDEEGVLRKFRKSGPAAVIVAVSLVVAVSAFGSSVQQQKTIVAIKAGVAPNEFSFTPKTKTVLKGAAPLTVAFTVANRGKLKHDFKIAGKKTLLIAPGGTRTLVVSFARTGRYPYICTVPSHALAGMKGTLIVKRPT
jgi:uncharacterized cupredoxin-like copper-binding protein